MTRTGSSTVTGHIHANLYVLNLTEMTQKQITSDSGYQGFPDVFSYVPTPPAYSRKVDFNSDGQEDILWRYYGTGAYQGLNLVWLMGQTGSLLPMASAEPQEATRIASVLTGMSEAKPAGLLNKSIESLLTSGKSREPQLRLRMKDPHTAGRMVPSSERQDVRGVSPNDINPRMDALHNLELASGQAGIAAVSVAQEVVFSQIADTAWEIAGTGDFNGDAKTDILWRYYGTGGYQGLNDIWFMDGTTFIGENVFSQIADTNWRIARDGGLQRGRRDRYPVAVLRDGRLPGPECHLVHERLHFHRGERLQPGPGYELADRGHGRLQWGRGDRYPLAVLRDGVLPGPQRHLVHERLGLHR